MLAEKAGVSKTAVSGWETGDSKSIDGDNLIAVARVLHVTPEYIMNGRNPPGKDQLTAEEQELIELYHDLTEEERVHFIGLLRAIHGTRIVPPPPLFDQDD